MHTHVGRGWQAEEVVEGVAGEGTQVHTHVHVDPCEFAISPFLKTKKQRAQAAISKRIKLLFFSSLSLSLCQKRYSGHCLWGRA